MSMCSWLNLVVGCLVTLALLQAAHSLHQATTSAARPGHRKQVATSCSLACQTTWESLCTYSNTVLLLEAGTNSLRAQVEVLHKRLDPW